MNTVSVDELNEFDETTNYRWTATYSGFYLINLNVQLGASVSGTYMIPKIVVNGTNYAETITSVALAGVNVGANTTWFGWLPAATYVEAFIYHNMAASKTLHLYTNISIIRIA
jgi:hypothetical protein